MTRDIELERTRAARMAHIVGIFWDSLRCTLRAAYLRCVRRNARHTQQTRTHRVISFAALPAWHLVERWRGTLVNRLAGGVGSSMVTPTT